MGKKSVRYKITNSFVKNAVCDSEKECTLWDSEIRGFGLRLHPSGKKSFIIWYRCRGRARLLTLGSSDRITADMARNSAKQIVGLVASGIDPAKQKEEEKSAVTMNDLCDSYMEEWAKSRKKTWREDERRLKKNIRPNLGNRLVNSIEGRDISKIHSQIGKTSPYEANRVLSLFAKMFEFGKHNGYLGKLDINPARGIAKFPERKRDRWAKDDELKRLLAEIDKIPSDIHRAGLLLYLLTGMRNRALMSRRHEDLIVKQVLDPATKTYHEQGYIRLKETKSGDPVLLPLSGAALEIFQNLPVIDNSPWFFPSPNDPSRHLDEYPRRIWYRVRRNAGLPDMRIHDLRRTYGSMLASSGVSLKVIADLLDQSTQSITDTVYAHLSDSATRSATESIAGKIVPFNELKKKSEEAS